MVLNGKKGGMFRKSFHSFCEMLGLVFTAIIFTTFFRGLQEFKDLQARKDEMKAQEMPPCQEQQRNIQVKQ